MIAENLKLIQENIAAACSKVGRSPESVKLVAVSKSKSLETIIEAIHAGQYIFGESYVQEADRKIAQLQAAGFLDGSATSDINKPRLTLHFVGSLQRRKSKIVVKYFDLIHSVDRYELMAALAEAASATGKVQKVLLQVNVSGETSKSGVMPEAVEALCRDILSRKSLSLKGLMCIGEFGLSENNRRQEFKLLREIRDNLEKSCSHPLPELSMGMSEDYAWAVEEGATLVRVGTALFGER